MDGRERRNYQRFYLSTQDMKNCLVVDQDGNGYETRIHNVSVGGLCFELLCPAVGPRDMLPPSFASGDEFLFACNENEHWGRHIRGRTGRITWRDGSLYGLRFDNPLGSAEHLAMSVNQDFNLLNRLRTRLWEGGLNTGVLLRRLSSDMAALLSQELRADADEAGEP